MAGVRGEEGEPEEEHRPRGRVLLDVLGSVWTGSHWVKIKASVGRVPPGDSRQGPFPAFSGFCGLLLGAPSQRFHHWSRFCLCRIPVVRTP